MRKYFIIIAGIIALPILIPIDWCAFWVITSDSGLGLETGFINAYGYYVPSNGISTYLGIYYTLAGMLPVGGSILIFIDAGVDKRALSAIGGLLLIAGSITWAIVHFYNASEIIALTGLASGSNVVAGEDGNATWSLSFGFFFPIVAGMIGLFGAGGRK